MTHPVSIPMEPYVYLDYSEKTHKNKTKKEACVVLSLYVGKDDTPVLQQELSFTDMLTELINTNSIPSTPLTTKPEYRANLLSTLDAFEAALKNARKQIVDMPEWQKPERSTSLKSEKKDKKIKKNKP